MAIKTDTIRTHNPRPPSERFHARKPSYAKREDFKQAVKVAAAQMAAKRYFNPKFNPKAGTDSSEQHSAKRDHKQAFATEAEEDTPKDLDQPEEQDMSDAEFEKELDDIYDNFAAEQSKSQSVQTARVTMSLIWRLHPLSLQTLSLNDS
jgi:hypothetical protein